MVDSYALKAIEQADQIKAAAPLSSASQKTIALVLEKIGRQLSGFLR